MFPYMYIVALLCVVSEDPPRPQENSLFQNEMSGYMPARGDFSTEYDNFAESNIKEVAFKKNQGNFERGESIWGICLFIYIWKGKM